MQQGFNRRTASARLNHAVREIGHHLFIRHLLAHEQGKHIVTEDTGESATIDRFEVGTGPFDTQYLSLPAAEVRLENLGGRIPSAPDHQIGIRPDEARSIHQDVQDLIFRGGLSAP